VVLCPAPDGHCKAPLQRTPEGSLRDGVAAHLQIVHGLDEREALAAASVCVRENGGRR
jgi:hypothetical protein